MSASRGDDRYSAASYGVNGGAAQSPYFVPGSCYDPVPELCMSLPLSKGLLLDLGGTDAYADVEGGAGTDVTVVPKGSLGLQVGIALLPG